MMKLPASHWGACLGIAALAACGGSSSGAGPSTQQGFLSGTWTGTLTLERPGEPATSASTTWLFEAVPNTNLQTFRVAVRSEHPWLPITTIVTSTITPGNSPPVRISTQGTYASPRGCTGVLSSNGTADAARIDADFSGIDCIFPPNETFNGKVLLTKSSNR